MNGTLQTIIIIAVLVFFLVASVFMQVFRARRSPLGRVVKIHEDIQRIEKFCDDPTYRRRTGRLSAKAWEKYREKIGFLPEELKAELTKLFNIVNEINVDIDASSKTSSNIYIATLNTEKMRVPLIACRDKLKDWVSANLHNRDYLPKKFGVFMR